MLKRRIDEKTKANKQTNKQKNNQVQAVPGRRHLEAQTDQVQILSGTSILKRRTDEKTKTNK